MLYLQKIVERNINRLTLLVFLTFLSVVTFTAISGTLTVSNDANIIGVEFPYNVYFPEWLPVLFRQIFSAVAVG